MTKSLIVKAVLIAVVIVFQTNCSENQYQPTPAEIEKWKIEREINEGLARILHTLKTTEPNSTSSKNPIVKLECKINSLYIKSASKVQRFDFEKIPMGGNSLVDVEQSIEMTAPFSDLNPDKIETTIDELIIPCKPDKKECVSVTTTETYFPKSNTTYSRSNALRMSLKGPLVVDYDRLINLFRNVFVIANKEPPSKELK